MTDSNPIDPMMADFFSISPDVAPSNQHTDLLDTETIQKTFEVHRIMNSVQQKKVISAIETWNTGKEMLALNQLTTGKHALTWYQATDLIFHARAQQGLTGLVEPKQKNLLSTDRRGSVQITSKTIAEHTLLVTVNITEDDSSLRLRLTMDRARHLASQCHPIDPNRSRSTRLIRNFTDSGFRYLTFAVSQPDNPALGS